MRSWLHHTVFLLLVILPLHLHAAERSFYLGGDISSLPELEKAGALYRDGSTPGDCITILHNHGMNLFRLRLFVNPGHDFNKTNGATQDLPMILALAKRVKTAGAAFSLAIHYSDTWADPKSQTKPAEWKDLPFDALQKKVSDYTTQILQAFKANNTDPDIVEVGNETTNGMLWPDGKINGHFDHYIPLLNAGIAAVRSQLPSARVLIHIDSGGKRGIPTWFFGEMKNHRVDYDLIGLSFYPSWNDSLEALKQNLADLAPLDKNILIIETAYSYRPTKQTPQSHWPMTPAGQKQFLNDLIAVIKAAPDHRGQGVVWWYPEAEPVQNLKIWNGGALGLFDQQGTLLPAMIQK